MQQKVRRQKKNHRKNLTAELPTDRKMAKSPKSTTDKNSLKL